MISDRRRRLAAELSTLGDLIAGLPPNDRITRIGLESRQRQLSSELKALAETPAEKRASVALTFGGPPVKANQGIVAKFGTEAVRHYQDVVSAYAASRRVGELKSRGKVPGSAESRLHITGTVRGSFGFQLAELDSSEVLLDRTSLAEVVDAASELLIAAADADEMFNSAIENVDERVISALGAYFQHLRSAGASFRIATGAIDHVFDRQAIERAAERTNFTIDEQELTLVGTFRGALVDHRRFDFRTNSGDLISGRVASSCTESELLAWNRRTGQNSRATLHLVTLTRPGRDPLKRYTLLALRDEGGAAS